MPLAPIAQQMIRKVEALSGRPVQVAEDPEVKVMAGILFKALSPHTELKTL